MQIYQGLDSLPMHRKVVATVGSYDGVHRGHRHLLEYTRREAERIGGTSMVITFDPHPRLALDSACDMRLLSSTEEKCRLIEPLGIDALLILHFDHAFSRTSPEDFVRLLREKVGVECLVIGYDHRFGRDKSGGKSLLEHQPGLRFIEVEEQEAESEHLSSTVIRRLIQKGEMAHAARLLGEEYLLQIEGQDDNKKWHAKEQKKLLPEAGLYRVEIAGGAMAQLRIQEDSTLELTPAPSGSSAWLRFKERI